MPSKTALVFLVLVLVGSLAALLRTPFYAVLLYEMQYFLNPVAQWWYGDLPDLRYSYLFMVLILLGFLMRSGEFRENRLWQLPQFRWLLLSAGIVLVTYFWAVNQDEHLTLAIRYLKILLFAVLAYKLVDTPRKMEQLLAVYVGGIFYYSWVARSMGRTGEGRLEGLGFADTLDANGGAAVVVTAVPLLLFYVFFKTDLKVRLAALVGLAFVLNCLILLNSRGAFLGLVVGSAYFCYFILAEPLPRRTKSMLVAGIVLAVCLFLYLADETFFTRMETLHEVDSADTGGHRTEFWMTTFEMLKDHPLGAGGSGFQLLSPNYLPPEWLSGGQRAVHSTWFEVLSEYGYHGLLVFVAYVLSAFNLLRKVRKSLRERSDLYHFFQSVALEASFASLLVAASFINFYYAELMYWLPFYMGAFANIHLFRASLQEDGAILPEGV